MTLYLDITNTPPRTSAPKNLYISSNVAEGNLAVTIIGGWSEYKPEQVEEIIASMQKWLSNLVDWACYKCQQLNRTTPLDDNGYKWIRCRHCKGRIPLEKIDFQT